jgi:hypothetical protein
MCDYSVQFYDAEEALIGRIEARDNPCARMRDALDRLKGNHGRTLIDRIGSCHAAAIDPDFRGFLLDEVLQAAPQTPISEIQPCEEARASLAQDVPSDRAFQVFKARPTKKNHCDFLLEVSNTEQGIINRFESTGLHCGVLYWLKPQHAKTVEIQMKVCDAAAVDPDDLVTHP